MCGDSVLIRCAGMWLTEQVIEAGDVEIIHSDCI